jgi:hypothetical protein
LYDEGAERLSCEKIKTFIGQYKTDCQNQKIDYKDKNNYLQYLDDTFGFADSAAKAKYLNEVLNSWEDKQLKAISFFECIDSILSNTFLAVISVEGANSTDEEKIFNLINTNGNSSYCGGNIECKALLEQAPGLCQCKSAKLN